jgi:hypothetical protein
LSAHENKVVLLKSVISNQNDSFCSPNIIKQSFQIIPAKKCISMHTCIPIMTLMHILLNSIDAGMKIQGSSRWGLRPYTLGFNVKQAGADAKLIQHGALGVAYHFRHLISTVPVARITAHTTVPGFSIGISAKRDLLNKYFKIEICS